MVKWPILNLIRFKHQRVYHLLGRGCDAWEGCYSSPHKGGSQISPLKLGYYKRKQATTREKIVEVFNKIKEKLEQVK